MYRLCKTNVWVSLSLYIATVGGKQQVRRSILTGSPLQRLHSIYTHTLTVTTEGEYTCTVSNNKPSSDSASIELRVCYDRVRKGLV